MHWRQKSFWQCWRNFGGVFTTLEVEVDATASCRRFFDTLKRRKFDEAESTNVRTKFLCPRSLSFTQMRFTQMRGVLMVPLPDVDGRMSCRDGTDGDGQTGSYSDLCLESFGWVLRLATRFWPCCWLRLAARFFISRNFLSRAVATTFYLHSTSAFEQQWMGGLKAVLLWADWNFTCNLFWFEDFRHTEALYQYLGSKQTHDCQGRSTIRKIYARWC